jgi:hypothetical protein
MCDKHFALPETKPGDQNIDQFFGVDITGNVPGTVSDGLGCISRRSGRKRLISPPNIRWYGRW